MNWQVLVDRLPEAVLVVGADGTVVYMNAEAEALTGYDAGSICGEPVTRFIPPEEGRRVDVMAWLGRWADSPAPLQWRFLHLTGRTRGGAELRLAVRVAKVVDDGITLYLVTLRDVGDEQRGIAELRHRHRVAARLLAIADDGVVMLDKDLNITWANGATERIFGHAAPDLVGRPLNDLLPARFRASHADRVREFAQSSTASRLMGQRGEVVGLHRDGHEIPLEASITRASIEGERVFAAHLRDITARKAAQAAREASERRFRAVFDHALEAMALLAPDGTVVDLNRAAAGLLGSAAGTVGATTGAFWDLPWWPQLQDPGGQAAARDALRQLVVRAAAGETVRAPARLVDATGNVHRLDFSLVPVHGAAGAVVYLIAEGREPLETAD